jgi:hypothetical protein
VDTGQEKGSKITANVQKMDFTRLK